MWNLVRSWQRNHFAPSAPVNLARNPFTNDKVNVRFLDKVQHAAYPPLFLSLAEGFRLSLSILSMLFAFIILRGRPLLGFLVA